MIVRKIALNGWRNYEFAAAEFSPGTNVITGENAQGKTNLLEAVYLLTGGKSFRTRFDKELIGEVVEKLHNVDIETLTPLEALNFLYELKNTLDKD